MKSGYIFPLFILFTFILESCIPSKEIRFQSMQPAGFVIPPSQDSILVLNLSYYPWVDSTDFNTVKNLSKSEAYIVDSMINKAIFEGLFSVLDQSEFENLRRTVYSEVRTSSTENYLDPIDLESINNLCLDFNTDIIVALEYYGFRFKKSLENYNWYMNTQTKTVWRTYMKDIGMIDEKINFDTIYFDPNIIKIKNDQNDVETDLIRAMKNSFRSAGENYGNYLSPHWEEIMCLYFFFLYKSEEISLDLEGLTRFISESGNSIRLYKAWVNLAVCYEKSGEPNKALAAINEAIKIRPNARFAEAYKKDLEKAFASKFILDNQFEQIINLEE